MSIFKKNALEKIQEHKKRLSDYTILLVDDDPLNITALSETLSSQYRVITATDGERALNMVKAAAPESIHVIITDQRMPNMKGADFLEASLPYQPDAVRIVVSGYSDTDAILKSINKGQIYQFLLKPLDKNEVLITVKRALESYKLKEDNKKLLVKQKNLIDELSTLNNELEQRVQARTEELKYKNQQITSSILYAQHIQNSILPQKGLFKKHFPNSFIFFKPRDLVSGDFYWFTKVNNSIFISVVDCTGHGVPGSLMSILGMNLLSLMIRERGLKDPATILENMSIEVRNMLNQNTGRNFANDSMDMALCRFDLDNRSTLFFAGAKQSLLKLHTHVDHLEKEIVKGSRRTVGGRPRKSIQAFETHEIAVKPGDTIYLYTDGFSDQFNASHQKFGTIRFKNMLKESYHYGLEVQKNVLQNTLEDFLSGYKQRDDITVLGFQL